MNKLCLQKDLFWEDQNAISNAIAAGPYFEVQILDDEWAMNPASKLFLGPGEVVRGSMDAVRKSGKTFAYANAMLWLPRFRSFAVSKDSFFLDLQAALELFNNVDKLFIRPVSPFKEFAGQVFTKDKLKKEIAWLEQGKNIHADELICVCADPQKIAKEWRCIFVNGRYISGSQYMENGEPSIKPGVPSSAIELAKQLAATSYFANIFDFVIDIGEVDGEPKLVEINSFESASFYAADLDKIYSAWNKSLPEKTF